MPLIFAVKRKDNMEVLPGNKALTCIPCPLMLFDGSTKLVNFPIFSKKKMIFLTNFACNCHDLSKIRRFLFNKFQTKL